MIVRDMLPAIGVIQMVERHTMPMGLAVLLSPSRLVVPTGLTLDAICNLALVDGRRRWVLMTHTAVAMADT